MSTTETAAPIYTIQVGTAGTFTDESTVDVAALVNSEIANRPAGDSLLIIFEPGVYAENSPILLPSNTSVEGNSSTLEELVTTQTGGNGALMANIDTYEMGLSIYTNHTDGTVTKNPYNASSTNWIDEEGTAKIDQNISVEGMTFNTTGALNYSSTNEFRDPTFGTWFTNAVNVDVQNNVYLGGVDGNAFVDVSNAVAANNIAIGQKNCAYDNWNGPTNVTIENDQSYMSGTSSSGWSVLFNSTPTGNSVNPGNASNDAVVDSVFSSYYIGSQSGNSDPLESYGFTTESNMTQQGNVISGLDLPNTGRFYSADVVSKNVIQDDVFTGQNVATDNYQIIGGYSSSATLAANSQIIGNLIFGAWNDESSPLVENQGSMVSTINNADINENVYQANAILTDRLAGASDISGNIINSGATITGSGTTPIVDISTEPSLFCETDTAINVVASVSDLIKNDTLSMTITSSFGSLSLGQQEGVVSFETFGSYGSQQGLVIVGSLAQVNTDLQSLVYTSNPKGWDDAIELNLSSSAALSATRYIPVTVENNQPQPSGGIILLPSSFLGTLAQESTLFSGQTLAALPNLNGEVAVSAAGDNEIHMGGSISAAFLGQGSNTVTGGTGQGYISTGTGEASINLSQGGDITVAGGAGSIAVNASNGDDMVEVGSSTAVITAGSSPLTVIGGLGNATITGSTGPLYIATLPQDGGRMNVDLGMGGSTVFALSGENILRTDPGSVNLIYTGLGSDSVISQGNDIIYTGAGSTTVYGSQGTGTDCVVGGTGSLTYVVGSENAIIAPAASTQIFDDGSGSITVGGGYYCLDVASATSSSNSVEMQTLGSVTLHSAILTEVLNDNTLLIGLNDGTSIQFLDTQGLVATMSSTGLLALTGSTLPADAALVFVSGLTGVSSDGSTNDAAALSSAEASLPASADLVFGEGTFDLNSDVQLDSAMMQGGVLSIDPATLSVTSLLTGTGVIDVGEQSVLALSGTISQGTTILLTGDAATLCMEAGASMDGDLILNTSSILDFQNIPFDNASIQVSADQLIVSDETTSETINISGSSIAGESLALQSDANGKTEVVTLMPTSGVPCFLSGTMIKTPYGQAPIEKLKIGDMISSSWGNRRIKWIGHRTYIAPFPANSDILPILIKKSAIDGRRPQQDLYVSPLHGLCINKVLVSAASLINGKSITQFIPNKSFTYYHIETSSHSIIYANGMTAETFIDEQSRRLFDNAAEFETLYPASRKIYSSPFKRLVGGIEVEQVRRKVALTAGVKHILSQQEDAIGFLEDTSNFKFVGWAYSPNNPMTPLIIEVIKDNKVVASTCANIFRADVKEAGICHGRCGFLVNVPQTKSYPDRLVARIQGTKIYFKSQPMI